jgi:hypothetical protein
MGLRLGDCPKCGVSWEPKVRYDKRRDILKLTCCTCGYEWEKIPCDSQGTPLPAGV